MNEKSARVLTEELDSDIDFNGRVGSEHGTANGGSPPLERVRPTVAPANASATEPTTLIRDERQTVLLDRLLSLADNYNATGERRQAVAMYLRLVDGNPQTRQALKAEARLIEVAEQYHEAGELRSARWIYEQLL
jgi:hypothetical protein